MWWQATTHTKRNGQRAAISRARSEQAFIPALHRSFSEYDLHWNRPCVKTEMRVEWGGVGDVDEIRLCKQEKGGEDGEERWNVEEDEDDGRG